MKAVTEEELVRVLCTAAISRVEDLALMRAQGEKLGGEYLRRESGFLSHTMMLAPRDEIVEAAAKMQGQGLYGTDFNVKGSFACIGLGEPQEALNEPVWAEHFKRGLGILYRIARRHMGEQHVEGVPFIFAVAQAAAWRKLLPHLLGKPQIQFPIEPGEIVEILYRVEPGERFIPKDSKNFGTMTS